MYGDRGEGVARRGAPAAASTSSHGPAVATSSLFTFFVMPFPWGSHPSDYLPGARKDVSIPTATDLRRREDATFAGQTLMLALRGAVVRGGSPGIALAASTVPWRPLPHP
jgi:hypothetical protein